MRTRKKYNYKTRKGFSPARRRNIKTRTKSNHFYQYFRQDIRYEITDSKGKSSLEQSKKS